MIADISTHDPVLDSGRKDMWGSIDPIPLPVIPAMAGILLITFPGGLQIAGS